MNGDAAEILTWTWNWFSGIVTFLFLALVGINRKMLKEHLDDHKKVVDYVTNKTSESAEELKDKKDSEWRNVIQMLDKLKEQNEGISKQVSDSRQETRNLQIQLQAKGLI